ncbi:hypothetical protein OF83DRAFT_1128590 [Amylostereum chailletii]|nr:hypothetical protein OF83DRAFT_1128590 [Amylostereum chailletii]
MVFLRRARVAVLSASVIFASVVLGLSASLIYDRSTDYAYRESFEHLHEYLATYPYPPSPAPPPPPHRPSVMNGIPPPPVSLPDHDIDTALTASVSIITLVVVPPLLIADLFKKKIFISTVAVEASVLFVLWTLWLTCGAYTAWCSTTSYVNLIRCQISPNGQCLEYKFVEGLSFVNWFGLMVYSNTLFTLAVINHIRNQPIWFAAVSDAPKLPPLVFATTLPVDLAKNMSTSTGTFTIPNHIVFPSSVPPLHMQAQPDSPHSTLPSRPSSLVVPPSPLSASHASDLHSQTNTRSGPSPPTYSVQGGPSPV